MMQLVGGVVISLINTMLRGAENIHAALCEHDPYRHPLGGFRCALCGKSAVALDELGYDHGYVELSNESLRKEANAST